MVKIAIFDLLKSAKMISRKIRMPGKLLNMYALWNIHCQNSQLGCPGLYSIGYSPIKLRLYPILGAEAVRRIM